MRDHPNYHRPTSESQYRPMEQYLVSQPGWANLGKLTRSEPARSCGDKVLWAKPNGSDLHVEGQRLDGDAPGLATWLIRAWKSQLHWF